MLLKLRSRLGKEFPEPGAVFLEVKPRGMPAFKSFFFFHAGEFGKKACEVFRNDGHQGGEIQGTREEFPDEEIGSVFVKLLQFFFDRG